MKKNVKKRSGFLSHFKVVLLIMKLTIFLIFSGLMTVSASIYSQATKLTLDLKGVSILNVLSQIETQSEFVFIYKNGVIDLNKKVDVKIEGSTVDVILDEILKDSGIKYEIIKKQIVLTHDNSIPSKVIEFLKGNSEQSQKKDLSGIVKDSQGLPLPGVSIVVKGTTTGVITDANGQFRLSVPADAKTLVFSFVGMKAQEVSIAGKTTFNVVMEEETVGVDEVVVVGYGTQKKVNLSGAVGVINSKEIANRPVTNVTSALQGLAPNLNISPTAAGGEMGAQMSINIRGTGSINGGGGSPYILVDGVEQSLDNLNPDDIENISVLKDASSSAIYGARAAFGVILVTTKKGKMDGKMTVNYSNNFRFATPIDLPHPVNSLRYAEYYNDAARNDGGGDYAIFRKEIIDKITQYMAGEIPTKDWTEPQSNLQWAMYQNSWANTNWFKETYRKYVPNSTHNLSLSGGNEKTQYYLSGSIFDQKGLMRIGQDKYSRNTINTKMNTKAYDWLRINFISKFSKTTLDRPSWDQATLYYETARRWPTMAPRFPDGTWNTELWPIYLEEGGKYNQNTTELTITPGLEIEPIKNWVIYANYRWKMNTSDYTKHNAKVSGFNTAGNPYPVRTNNDFTASMYENYYASPNIYSTFDKSLGNHNFKIMAGFEQEEANYSSTYAQAYGLITDNVPSISTATGQKFAQDTRGHWSTRSFFGRFNYNFEEKYLIELSIRRDGSSKFARDYRWGTFPSGSVAYLISKESFWEPISKYVNQFKIRGSYGSLGNQNVANYLYIAQLPVSTNLGYIMGNERPNYVGMPGLISPSITWEKVNTTNIGIDAGFLKNRLTVSADYFIRNTLDMLGPSESLPGTLGSAVPRSNNATLQTKGFELVLGWNDKIGSFKYGAKFMLSDATSKILDYYNPQNLLSAAYYKGRTLGEIWGYTTKGLYQSADDIINSADQTFLYNGKWTPGDVQYVDLNDDKKINNGKNTLQDHGDLSIIGNSTPRYSYSLLLNAAWKGFDFNMLWQGIGKRELNVRGSWFFGAYSNKWESTAFEQQMDYWREDNTNAYYPKPYLSTQGVNKNCQVQTRFLQNGAYLRLKSVQLGYTLPKTLTQKVSIDNFRIFVSGENMLTFTKLAKMFDPETAQLSYWSAGSVYPLQQFISFGVSVTL